MRLTHRTCMLSSTAALLAAMPALGAEAITISDIAPPTSFMVMSVPNFTEAKAAFDRTGLKEIWEEESVKKFIEEHTKELAEDWVKSLESLDIDPDDLSLPTGAVGVALWIGPNPDAEEERGVHALLFADFGENAQAMNDHFITAIEDSEEKGEIEIERDEYEGTTILVMIDQEQSTDGEAEEADEDDVEIDEEDLDDGMSGLEEESPFHLERVYFAHHGNHLLMCTELGSMERALDRLAGKTIPCVEDNPDLAASVAQLAADHHAHAVVLAAPLMALLEDAGENEITLGPVGQVRPILDALGISGIRSVSTSFKFDAEDAMLEQSIAMLAPEKKGLLALASPAPVAVGAPAFVSPDASMVTRVQFDFSGIFPLIKTIMKEFPAEAEQAAFFIESAEKDIGPILANLGPEIVIAQSLTRPFSAESQRTLVAIKSKDASALTESLTQMAAMIGADSRDFQGNMIWSLNPQMMPMLPPQAADMAFSVASGYLFVGPTADVESAIRQAAAGADNPSLNSDPRFQRAVKPLAPESLAFSYSDMRQVLDYMDWTFKNMEQMVEAEIKATYGDDPEFKEWRDQMIEQAKADLPGWMKEIPIEAAAKHMGDAVMEVHSTPEGFRIRSLYLRPAAE